MYMFLDEAFVYNICNIYIAFVLSRAIVFILYKSTTMFYLMYVQLSKLHRYVTSC